MTSSFTSPDRAARRGRFGCFTVLGFVTAGFLGLIVVFALVVVGVTAAPVSAANAFFKTAATQGSSAAYALTAPLFRTVTSQTAFDAVAATANLSAVDKATWNSRGTLNGVARLSGHLHYKGGSVQNVAVQLSKTDGRWRLLWLDIGPNAVANLAASDPSHGLSTGPVAPAALAPAGPAGLSGPGVPSDTTSSDGSAPSTPTGLGGGSPPPLPTATSAGPTIDLFDARTILADGTPAVRGSAVGLFCKTLFQQARAIRYDRVDCPISLAMTPGAQTRCVAYWDQHSVGMTALYQGQGVDRRAQVHCQADTTPLS